MKNPLRVQIQPGYSSLEAVTVLRTVTSQSLKPVAAAR